MEGSLRILAVLGILVLPAAWLASLSGDVDVFHSNVVRTIGAIVGGGTAWIRRGRRDELPSWTSCLVGGVAGSLVVSALSLFVPGLGRFAAAGWLTSGIVGGGAVALAAYAAHGKRAGVRR